MLAFLDGRLVGQAVVTSRWSQNGDGPLLKTAYVDAVSTSEDEQRRGIGSAVMTHLISSIDDFDIACLKTDVVAFYERLGWREWYGPLGGRADDRIIPTPEQTGLMLFRLARTPAIDPTQLLTIEAHAARIW